MAASSPEPNSASSYFTLTIAALPAATRISDSQATAVTKQRGITLAVADGLIAATSLEYELTMVTRNDKDFKTAGVDVLNPWAEQLQKN